MTMRERVARALFAADTSVPPCATFERPTFKAEFLKLADAAIAAIRIPTDDMIQAVLASREDGLCARRTCIAIIEAAQHGE